MHGPMNIKKEHPGISETEVYVSMIKQDNNIQSSPVFAC